MKVFHRNNFLISYTFSKKFIFKIKKSIKITNIFNGIIINKKNQNHVKNNFKIYSTL